MVGSRVTEGDLNLARIILFFCPVSTKTGPGCCGTRSIETRREEVIDVRKKTLEVILHEGS